MVRPPAGIVGVATDNFGHGTVVASVLAAAVDNGVPTVMDDRQFSGVDPGCTLVSARVGYANGYFLSAYLDSLEAFYLDPVFADIKVINISFPGYDCPTEGESGDVLSAMEDLRSWTSLLHYRGVFIVTISGNGGVNLKCPNIWEYVVMIGATDSQDERWTTPSNSSGISPYLDFVAPGFGMYAVNWDHPCDLGVTHPSGTSMAAPVVAGIASLLHARANVLGITLTPAMIYECLKQGALPLGGAPYQNPEFGWGRVNAHQSLLKMEELYYNCDADVTHGNVPGVFGYGVPDGDVDPDDWNYFYDQWEMGNVGVADIASTCSPCGEPGCSTPDGFVTGHDLAAFGCLFSAGCP